jgi:hypothetical protein
MADDFLNTTSTTGRLSVGGTSSGNIEVSDDTDWFRISLVAGQTYQFDLRGSPSGNGTLSDPYMSLRNSSGSSTRLAEDDNTGTGNDSQFTYTAITTGDHFVAAGASVGGIGTYQITTFQTAKQVRAGWPTDCGCDSIFAWFCGGSTWLENLL